MQAGTPWLEDANTFLVFRAYVGKVITLDTLPIYYGWDGVTDGKTDNSLACIVSLSLWSNKSVVGNHIDKRSRITIRSEGNQPFYDLCPRLLSTEWSFSFQSKGKFECFIDKRLTCVGNGYDGWCVARCWWTRLEDVDPLCLSTFRQRSSRCTNYIATLNLHPVWYQPW